MQLINTDFYAGLVDSLSMEGVNEKKRFLALSSIQPESDTKWVEFNTGSWIMLRALLS